MMMRARIGLSFSYCCMRHYYSCSPHTHESRRHVAAHGGRAPDAPGWAALVPPPGSRSRGCSPPARAPARAATNRRPRATDTRFALPRLHANANSALSQTRTQRLLSISSLKKSSASWSEGMLVLAAMLSVTSQPTAGTRMRTHAKTRSLSASATGGFKEVSCGPL